MASFKRASSHFRMIQGERESESKRKGVKDRKSEKESEKERKRE